MKYKVEDRVKIREDLRFKDIIKLKNGDELILLANGNFVDILLANNSITHLGDFNEDLKCSYNNRYDIVKVERATHYDTVFVREQPKEKMTVAQICEELGREVEIVKDREKR